MASNTEPNSCINVNNETCGCINQIMKFNTKSNTNPVSIPKVPSYPQASLSFKFYYITGVDFNFH